MAMRQPDNDEPFRRFLRRTWREDVTPLLRGEQAERRAKTARATGKAAAATGLFVDSLLGLKGKPFARFMTVMGSSLGAMLPDVWDWKWLREKASPAQRQVVADQVRRSAERLAESEALGLFGLSPTASREELKSAWRAMSQRWHPDKAGDVRRQAEYHVRFLTYNTAYDLLSAAYDAGHLPRSA